VHHRQHRFVFIPPFRDFFAQRAWIEVDGGERAEIVFSKPGQHDGKGGFGDMITVGGKDAGADRSRPVFDSGDGSEQRQDAFGVRRQRLRHIQEPEIERAGLAGGGQLLQHFLAGIAPVRACGGGTDETV